ncbi:unnamed protein product, partial [Mesorhabditis belari]|uniref:MARVEL domain-containing protein n=1 Tax=Mesorhabditis belari TaxID=2138241 RepID=A0AAF3EAR9_9BILA
MARQPNWFCTPLPTLKVMQIVCAVVIVLFFLDGRQQWWPYTFIFVLAIFTMIGNAVLLALHYFDVVRTNNAVPWLTVEMIWNGLLAALYLVVAITMSVDWWKMRNGQWMHHSYLPPKNIGQTGWQSRVLCVLVVSVTNVILFILLLNRLRVYKIQ